MRLEHLAAVGDRGVDGGELQRRDEGVALADGEVGGVAAAVAVAVVAELLVRAPALGAALRVDRALAVVVPQPLPPLLQVRPVGDRAAALAGQVDAGARPEPEAPAPCAPSGPSGSPRGVAAVAQPLLVGEVVEDRVAGPHDRGAQRDRPERLALEVALAAERRVRAGARVDAVARVSVPRTAAVETTLNVDAGAYAPWIARTRAAPPGSRRPGSRTPRRWRRRRTPTGRSYG